MQTYYYKPEGVCSKQIIVVINDDNLIESITFLGGCQGNLKAISKLLQGKTPTEAGVVLKGITCGSKNTSCADQLSKMLLEEIPQA